jgi:EmrB/QacA subfamily drug resistance transporter
MSLQTAETPAVVLSPGRRTVVLLVILLAFFVDLLDTTIVNIAIPSIRRSMGASYSQVQWIVAGYQLAFALLLITGGRLGDIFGYRTIFLIGMAGFTIASALCGLSQTTSMLVASRLLQGGTAALMVPQILSTIQVMYTREERANVSAFYGALAGIAAVSGPIVGALLITGNVWGLGWRAIFLVNIPVGVFATVAAFFLMPKVKSPHPLRLDLPGVALALVAMLFLLYPLIQGRDLDWPNWTFWTMAASIPVFLIFAFDQARKGRRNASPLVEPSLFRTRSFVAGLVVNASMYGIIAGFFLMFTVFLQIGLGYGVLKAGLSGIPFSIGVALTAGLAGPYFVPRLGRRALTVGALVMAAGIALLAAAAWYYGGDLTPWHMIPSLFLSGAGLGMIVAPIVVFILSEVPVEHAGSGSGIVNAVGQVGGAVGVAVIGVIFFGLLASGADRASGSVREALAADLQAADIGEPILGFVVSGFQTCFRDRSKAKDPSEVPASCQSPAGFTMPPAVAAAIETHGQTANQRNFTAAFVRTLGYEVAALLLIFLLIFLLPRHPRQQAMPLH